MRSLTTHLRWEPREAVAAKEDVLLIEDHPGLSAIYDAIEAKKLDLTRQLAAMASTDNGAQYADIIGQIKALDDFPMIVAGIIEYGRKAEFELREQTEG